MRAIDLYSGIGGWSLGLGLAGIDVVASYEWWDRAADTHRNNLGSAVHEVDIRQLSLEALPEDIQIVVGSPPCTQFSFSNRGGSGDLADGLKDIAKFLAVVEYLGPSHWAMENVPRVAGILRKELAPGGSLRRFAHLVDVIEVFDIADFGLPQGRKRMLAGSYDLDLLKTYRPAVTTRTLGDVVAALQADPVLDPIYDVKRFQDDLTDHAPEAPLTDEEERMNRESKTYHPVYNRMQFPDSPDRAARTVTALCTRVSRESIVIARPEGDGYRRLTLRERASLQGFPISFEFYGRSYSDKLKLIGNALPPPMAYYLGQAFQGVRPEALLEPAEAELGLRDDAQAPLATPPTPPRRRYPASRRYRGALPHLRFGSGMRFELANQVLPRSTKWGVDFYYGTSGRIQRLHLDSEMLDDCLAELPEGARDGILSLLEENRARIRSWSDEALQARWTHSNEESPHPFEVADELGDLALAIHEQVASLVDGTTVTELVLRRLPSSERQRAKLTSNASWLLAGFVVGSFFNSIAREP